MCVLAQAYKHIPTSTPLPAAPPLTLPLPCRRLQRDRGEQRHDALPRPLPPWAPDQRHLDRADPQEDEKEEEEETQEGERQGRTAQRQEAQVQEAPAAREAPKRASKRAETEERGGGEGGNKAEDSERDRSTSESVSEARESFILRESVCLARL